MVVTSFTSSLTSMSDQVSQDLRVEHVSLTLHKSNRIVLAVGAYAQTFGVPGVKEHATFLKDVSDARRIRMRIIERFEQAASPNLSDTERRALLHFAIVGGGPTGIEFAAELHGKPYSWSTMTAEQDTQTYVCVLSICCNVGKREWILLWATEVVKTLAYSSLLCSQQISADAALLRWIKLTFDSFSDLLSTDMPRYYPRIHKLASISVYEG